MNFMSSIANYLLTRVSAMSRMLLASFGGDHTNSEPAYQHVKLTTLKQRSNWRSRHRSGNRTTRW